MAIKFLSGLNLSDVTAGSILKLDSNGNIVAATAGTDYATSNLWTTTGSDIYRNSSIRVGTYQAAVAPDARLHVFDYQTTTPKILIEDGNTGDASMQFKISTQQYTMGIDNSDSDKFVIAASSALGTTNALEISTTGVAQFGNDIKLSNGWTLSTASTSYAKFGSWVNIEGTGFYTTSSLYMDLDDSSSRFVIRSENNTEEFIGNTATDTFSIPNWSFKANDITQTASGDNWSSTTTTEYNQTGIKLSRSGSGYVSAAPYKLIGSFTASVSFKTSNCTHLGIIFAASESNQDDDNYGVILRNNGGNGTEVRVQKRVNGGQSYPISAVNVTTDCDDGDWHELTVSYNGKHIVVDVDGTNYFNQAWTDTSFTSPGLVGLAIYDNTCQFNDFQVTETPSTTTFEKLQLTSTEPQLLIKNPVSSTGNAVLKFEEQSGSTQNATITFNQGGQNNLTIATGYQSSNDENRIYLAPAGNIGLTVRGGTGSNNGNVGIGTTSPSELLELQRDGKIGFGANGNYGIRTGYFDDTGGVHGFHIDTKHAGTWSTRRLVVRADSGNVGIGTDSPDFKLDVAGDIGMDGKLYHNGDHNTYIGFGGDIQTFRTGGSDRMTITNSGIGIGTTSPGTLLDVNGVARIQDLRFVSSGGFKSGYNTWLDGATAQNVLQQGFGGLAEGGTSDHLIFNAPDLYESTTTSGGSYSDVTSTYASSWKDLFTGQRDSVMIANQSVYSIRMTWDNIGYKWFDTFYSLVNLQGNVFSVKVEKYNGTAWTTVFTRTGFTGWEGRNYHTYKWNNSGHSSKLRITLDFTWNNTNAAYIYRIAYYGGYPSYGGGRVFDWDYDKNLNLGGSNLKINGGTILSDDGTSHYVHSASNLYLYSGSSATMTLASGGNVGIGETNPTSKLEVRGTTATHQLVSINRANSSTAALYLGNNSSNDAIISGNNAPISLGKDVSGTYTEYVNIATDGELKFSAYGAGILKTNSAGIVSLDTNTYLTSIDVDWNDIDSINGTININSTTQIGQGDTETLVSFQNSGTERGRFEVDSATNSYFVATGFKTTGSSTGLLKSDGTIDTSTYATTADINSFIEITDVATYLSTNNYITNSTSLDVQVGNWLSVNKGGASTTTEEAGIRWQYNGTTQYWFYTDNGNNGDLRLQAAGITGETDNAPRLIIPRTNKDLYLGVSGGKVGIGTTSPNQTLSVTGDVSATDQISVNNRTAISVLHWSSSGSSTGAIKITLPGSHSSNWSMIVLRITAYEYNSTAHTVYYVSGHDWTSGWYNNGVTKIGNGNKDIQLGYDSNKDYVILGGTASTWSYGHVTVDVMAHPSFYSSNMDISSGWEITQTTDLSGITTQAVTNKRVLTTSDEGSGNGIDADTVDGLQASSFLRSDATDTATGNLTFSGAVSFTSSSLHLSGHYYQKFHSGTTNYIHFYPNAHSGNASVTYMRAWTGSSFRALKIQGDSNNITWGSHTLWTSGNDGSGSGLDADQLDGKHASDFVAVTGDDMSGKLTISTSEDQLLIDNTASDGSARIRFKASSTRNAGPYIRSTARGATASDSDIRIGDENGDIATFNGGNVGIGTTSPGGKLHLEGDFESGKALVIKGTYGTDTEYYFRTHGTNSEYLALYAAGTRIMNFNSGIVDTYKGLRLFGGAISTGTSNHLVIGSSVQIGQGDEDPVIEFKYGTTSLGKIDQFGDIHAGGFKVSGTTGFLKSDGSVDTSTYASSSALSSYLPLTGGTVTGDLVIDSGSTGSTTQVYSAFDTLTFNNLHNSVAAGPNKIIMYDDGAWKGGFGIHSSTVAYYSGDTHKWYKTASGPGGPTFTERMTLDGSGDLSVDGTLTAGGTITGTGGSFTDTITSTKNGTALVMDGGSSAEGVRMKADSSTTYPVFLRTLNPSGGGETSAWLFKEANTAWGIWHNNPSNTIDFTRSPATGIANDVGGGDNTVMIRLDMQYGHGRFAGDVYSSNLTISDGIYHEGDTNTSITFGTDTINFNTGGGTRATINDSGAKFNNNVIVGGGSTLSLGQAGEEDDNGRTVLIEGVANGSNGEGSGRIFFSENNNTATNLYGLSLYYEGDGNAQLPSGFQPNTGNATWSLRQHNNSLNGSAIISGSRGNNNVTFGGNLYVPNVIYHTGDTNTYMQFHAGDQWRVVTGGSERLEVNNTYTTVANDFWAEDKSHAGNQNWKTKTYVRSVGVEGGSIADKWVHLTTVDIDAAYDKAALKFKIHGFDDVSCGTENIDVLYENAASSQETHRLDWYSTDGTANLFKAVKSTHSGSNLAHSYELWVQMAGDWRDTFTVEVETWTDEAGFITYSEAVGQATAPSGDSNDQSKTSREWYTKNTTIYADGTALQTQSQADSRYLQLTGGTVSGAVTLGAQLTLSSFGTGVLRVDAGSVSVDTSNYLTSMPANSTVTSVTFGGVKVEEALDRPGLLEINRDGTDTWSGIMTKFSGTAEWALMGNETSFGLYDDQQNEWAWRYVENSYFEAYNDGSVKLQTASNGVKILNVLELGNLGDTNGGVLKLNGTTANKQAVIKCTNGNLHIDSEDGNALYLNYYEGTSDNIIFGNGNGGASGAKVTSSGVVHATSVEVAGNLSVRNITARDIVSAADRTYALGTDANRWAVVFCETLDSAGQHESNLQDKEQPISHYETGTVLSWKDGKNRPCTQYADHMRMGIAVHGQDSPLIQGAEPVLCTGVVEEGDYLVTSDKEGHAVAVPRNIVKEQMLFDCVIGKALENGDGESHLVKTWINI